MSEDTGRLVGGRYRLGEVLGRGGMGTVWRGEDEILGRRVAVKELRFPSSVDDEEKQRLITRTLREAKAIARIRSGSAVTVFDVVNEDSRPWIVMELVEGRSLADKIKEDGPLSPQRAAEVGLAILDVLRAAHREGILHRDVKPSNVLLEDGSGRVVLTDFGIAKVEGDPSVTSTGMLVGAPSYISPERARGKPPGPPADLWSLGGLLFAAVEGRPPYDKGSAISTLTAVMTEPVPSPANAAELSEVIAGLLVKDPDKRLDVDGARRLLQPVASGLTSAPARGADSERTSVLPTPVPAGGDGPSTGRGGSGGGAASGNGRGKRRAPGSGSGERLWDALKSVRNAAGGAAAAGSTRAADAGGPAAGASGSSPSTGAGARSGPAVGSGPAPSRGTRSAGAASGGASGRSRKAGDAASGAARGTRASAAGVPPAPSVPPRPTTPPPSAAPTTSGSSGSGASGTSGASGASASGPGAGPGAGKPLPSASGGSRPSFRKDDSANGGQGGASGTSSTGLGTGSGSRALPPETGGSGAITSLRDLRELPELRKGIPRRTMAIGAAAVVAVIVLIVVIVVATSASGDSDDNGAGRGGQGGAQAEATSEHGSAPEDGKSDDGSAEGGEKSGGEQGDGKDEPAAEPGTPPGYAKVSDDRFHFSMSLPKGWERTGIAGQNSGGKYSRPGGGLPKIQVDFNNKPAADAAKSWRQLEPAVKGASDGYRPLGIEKNQWRGYPTVADWQFTRDENGTRVRVLNRGFKVDGGRGYAIMITCKADGWDDKPCTTLRRAAFASFRPAD
ncbi:serine/threonine-protein kinase [Streptomyces cacaoi]